MSADIAPFGDEHLDAAARLYVAVFNAPPWHERWTPAVARRLLAETLGTPGALGYVLGGDEPAGLVLGYGEERFDGTHFYLKELCVHPGRQRAGLGTRLLRHLEGALQARQVAHVYLLTMRDGPAQDFYAKHGYYVSPKMALMAHRLRPDGEPGAAVAAPRDGTEFASREVAVFWRYIASSLDRLVELGVGLDEGALHWRPPAPDTNSLYVLAVHTLGNAEENILETLCGLPIGRDREGEFVAHGAAADLSASWQLLRPRLRGALARLPASEMDRERPHPRRGTVTGREVLIVVARHAAEHLGQAGLTRDLYHAPRR